jgi:ABC-type polysaccharide/polyol phosphate export permease
MWGTFVKGTSTGMNSLTAKRGIIGRMPLPLEIPVMSALVTSLLLMMIEFVALFLFMVAYQFLPPSTIALLPALIVLESILILGVSFPLAALGALYKDVRHAWTILIYAAFFVTGIFYDINHLPDELRQLIYYNPMADVVALSRTLAMGNPLSADFPWAYMIGIPFLALFAGYAVFRRYHDRIVEEM